MDATSAASNSQGATSALPAERGNSAADSFIGPRPEPCGAGGLDASAAAGYSSGGCGGGGNGGMTGGSSVHEEKGHDDDDLAGLADVDVHVALQDMDESETDDEDNNNADPSTADHEVTARAPSMVNGWDDHAATACFERALRMHSMTAGQLAQETNGDGWEAGPNVLPPTVARSTSSEKGAARNATEKNEATAIEQPLPNVVATTSIPDHFGENEDGSTEEEDQKRPWKPRPLPLPAWAVDPIYAGAHLTSKGLGDSKRTPA